MRFESLAQIAHRPSPPALKSRHRVGLANFNATGVFGVNYCVPHVFTADETRMLEALARRAAMAIENARLYERAQQVATLEERQRLARELHDALTQTLFAANLIAEALPNVWRVDVDEAEQALAELRRLSWGALAEMRTLLLELRPAALANSRFLTCCNNSETRCRVAASSG